MTQNFRLLVLASLSSRPLVLSLSVCVVSSFLLESVFYFNNINSECMHVFWLIFFPTKKREKNKRTEETKEQHQTATLFI